MADKTGPSERPTLVDIDLPAELADALSKPVLPEKEAPSGVMPGASGEMRRAFAAGDFELALSIAQDLVVRDPRDGEAASFAESARLRMRHVYASKLGSLLRVPYLSMAPAQIRTLKLSPQALALVSRIDGYITFEDILDDAGAPDLETLRMLCELLSCGVLSAD